MTDVRKSMSEDQFVNAIADMPLHSIALLYGAGASRTLKIPGEIKGWAMFSVPATVSVPLPQAAIEHE